MSDVKYEPISKVESPFPIKPEEPNYFNARLYGECFSETDLRVYPERG